MKKLVFEIPDDETRSGYTFTMSKEEWEEQIFYDFEQGFTKYFTTSFIMLLFFCGPQNRRSKPGRFLLTNLCCDSVH